MLTTQGLVYSECPFIQPVHGGAFDFTRLTHPGHRRAWRHFEEIVSGVCGGPGMALGHVIQSFCRSLLPGKYWQKLSDYCTDWMFWWIKYLDGLLVHNPSSMDVASGFYFLGRKSCHRLSDSELIESYWDFSK